MDYLMLGFCLLCCYLLLSGWIIF
uniref:Uncharacterized protein n=1 Tax=Anguilla anguilla TaxID=7936 RepID=A0A0E9VWL7_ANGAN